MCFIYIIFSKKLDRFYIGSTELHPTQRLELHNNQYYGKLKFTSNGIPWELFWYHHIHSKRVALKIEKHIKKMKSRKYILNIKKYPNIMQKLIEKYYS